MVVCCQSTRITVCAITIGLLFTNDATYRDEFLNNDIIFVQRFAIGDKLWVSKINLIATRFDCKTILAT